MVGKTKMSVILLCFAFEIANLSVGQPHLVNTYHLQERKLKLGGYDIGSSPKEGLTVWLGGGGGTQPLPA